MTTAVAILALTLWGEARGEGPVGLRHVASVIQNRAEAYQQTPVEVCLARRQFSCWLTVGDETEFNQPHPKSLDDPVWQDCIKLASQMLNGEFKPLHEATHYYNPSLCSPKWAKAMTEVTVYKQHRFMKE